MNSGLCCIFCGVAKFWLGSAEKHSIWIYFQERLAIYLWFRLFGSVNSSFSSGGSLLFKTHSAEPRTAAETWCLENSRLACSGPTRLLEASSLLGKLSFLWRNGSRLSGLTFKSVWHHTSKLNFRLSFSFVTSVYQLPWSNSPASPSDPCLIPRPSPCPP